MAFEYYQHEEKIFLYNQLGKFYLAKREFQNAQAVLEKGLSYEKDYVEANHPDMIEVVHGHLILGQLFKEMSKPEEELKEYQKVIAFLKAHPNSNMFGHWNLSEPGYTLNVKTYAHIKSGEIYKSLGDLEAANAEFKLAQKER